MPPQGHFPPQLRTPATLILIAAAPLFLYPCLYAVLLADDTLFGDRLILDLLSVSKRNIWDLFWEDWAAALPLSYVVVLPTLSAALFVHRRTGRSLWMLLPALALVASLVVTIAIFSGEHMMVISATAIVFSIPATWVLSRCAS